jgi:hypothetical protein
MPDWLSRMRAPEDEPPPAEQPASEEGEGDWLARLRATDPDWSSGRAQAEHAGTAATEPLREAPPPARPAGGEGPDWLGRLREATSEEQGPPEGELPAWLADEAPPASPAPEAEPPPAARGEVPEWLARVRARHADEVEEEEEEESTPPLLQPDVFDLEKTGWHSGLTGLLPAVSDIPEFQEPQGPKKGELPEPAPTALEWNEPVSKPIQPKKRSGKLSERIAKVSTGELAKAPPAEAEPPTGPPPAKGPVEAEVPAAQPPAKPPSGPFGARTAELFPAEPGRPGEGPAEPGRPGEGPAEPPAAAWPPPPSTSPLGPVWPPSPPPTPPFGAGGLEDETGLSSLVPVAEEPDSQPTQPPQVLPSTSPLEEPPAEELAEPEWMKELRRQTGPLPPAAAGPPAQLPHVSALVPGVSAEGLDFDLDNVEVPDWLTEAGSLPSEAAIAPEARPDLAPATLPTWLEAMRPVDTFRSVVELLPEEDQAVESAGPLAGLRGVLMAEPVVALPRITGVGSTRLNVTERQTRQAELLTKMVQEELREAPPMTRGRRRLPLLRWAVAGLLLLAVALPILLRLSVFPLPSVEPIELGPLVNLVAALPADRPALLVFDYEPANAGELEVVAGPLLEDMMAKGLQLATLSTRPTGPPLAERLLRQRAAAYEYQSGEDYVHLGYLSGGVPAIQLFAASPRQAVLSGFAASIDEPANSPAGWGSPVVEGVQSLSDFSALVVITAGAESARSWIEQASPYLNDRPLVMVLSAGVEPMIRPYYEALDPQVKGLLSGEPAAVAYELRTGRAGPAVERWNPFSLGILVAELLLICGGLYGVGVWLLGALRPRPKAKRA